MQMKSTVERKREGEREEVSEGGERKAAYSWPQSPEESALPEELEEGCWETEPGVEMIEGGWDWEVRGEIGTEKGIRGRLFSTTFGDDAKGCWDMSNASSCSWVVVFNEKKFSMIFRRENSLFFLSIRKIVPSNPSITPTTKAIKPLTIPAIIAGFKEPMNQIHRRL